MANDPPWQELTMLRPNFPREEGNGIDGKALDKIS
jgi:hypothetical protein